MRYQSQIAVHLGGHRTGTTLLQGYMYRVWGKAKAQGCAMISTAETRKSLMKHLFADAKSILKLPDQGAALQAKLRHCLADAKVNGQSVLLSEENIIGTMESNLAQHSIYPNITDKLAMLRPSFEHVDTFYLSIRRLDEFWASSLAYLIARDESPPMPQKINMLAASSRTWRDVVQDICTSYPDARLVVRECNYLLDNPKRQLIKALGWTWLNDTKGFKKRSNGSKDPDRLRTILQDRGDPEGAARIVGDSRYMPFGRDQIGEFKQQYESDLQWMRDNLKGKHRFLEQAADD